VHWWPLFTILLGTGCRIGEGLGLRWEDIDFEKNLISINHSLTYYPTSEDRTTEFHIHKPKTDAGIRTIPLLDSVRDALDILREEEDLNRSNEQEVDGYSGFIFQNRFGTLPNPAGVNRTIKRIVNSYNADERLSAAREGREPLLLPEFSCHHLRHTFATRLCEVENNLKVIQSIMGHKNIETTMDVYAEATDRKKEATFEKLAAKLDELF
jgi:integrase